MRGALLVSIALVVGCKTTRPTAVTPPPPTVERPSWVDSRPVTGAYYVGIGVAPKSSPDPLESAKKNALNDLASEISVTVEGNSLLYTLDSRSHFSENYTSTVRTRTSEQLEGFELVDSWDSGTEHWTYYRLSKAEHARIKAERKRKAFDQAIDLHTRSATALAGGDLRSAFDQDLRALLAIRDHWGEADQVELEGRTVNLANELYTDLQRLIADVRLGLLPERCELTYADHFRRELLISARFQRAGSTRDLAQLPLMISFPGSSGMVHAQKNTDPDGQARVTVERIDLASTTKEVVVRLDMEDLVNADLDPVVVKPLLAGLAAPEARALIDVRMPKVFLRVTENNFGKPAGAGGVSVALREELGLRGFRFVERESESDMVMKLDADTREGGTASGFFTAYLDVTISYLDRRTGDLIYQGGKQGLKGVQLTYEKAGLEAYKKGAQDLRNELVPALLNAVL
ncbi:MAG: LPP20 family lipoprotein [Flavobacteriales bacterium]|nr:LPP20 family lipoprotein [Flavobacteriales bacterium]MBK7270222.1 LPP20 family lipoprotein [Flavobacteriales bacterium]MBK7754079.1 LPP20 family lipoprotein [Flavobacteriales bacterium]MBK9075895.1 LPP20 family lipoprotein [Flavobacteriales bacterium]MBK9537339.1 LPP20 family lipoprotein [Flavobacteriales bacterium]